MTLTDASSTAPLPSRALGLIAALPPVLIVAGAAALGYTQGPNSDRRSAGSSPRRRSPSTMRRSTTRRSRRSRRSRRRPPRTAEVITPQPLPVVKHAAKKPVARAPHERVVNVRTRRQSGITFINAPTNPPMRQCQFRFRFVRRPRRADVRGIWRPLPSALREGATMPEVEISQQAGTAARLCRDARRGDGRGGVGGFALWASQNMKIGQPLWWQAGSLAAVLVAAKLTLAATKQRGQMRPQRSLLDSFNAKLDAASAALNHMPESEKRRPKTGQRPRLAGSKRSANG